MHTLVLTSFMLLFSGDLEDRLPTKEDVVLHFNETPFYFEDTLYDPKGNIILLNWDVTKDNKKDIFITCENCFTEDRKENAYHFRIYSNYDEYYQLLSSGMCIPLDLLLLKDEQGQQKLATVLYWNDGLVGPLSYVVVALELDRGHGWGMPIIREIKEEALTSEDKKWLEDGRIAAKAIAEIYTPEDIAAISEKKEAENVHEAVSLGSIVDEVDGNTLTLPVSQLTEEAKEQPSQMAMDPISDNQKAFEKEDAKKNLICTIGAGVLVLLIVILLAVVGYRFHKFWGSLN